MDRKQLEAILDDETPRRLLIVGDLMLDVDVVAAVEADKFSVQAVSSVQDAIELFTGKPAGAVLDAVRMTLARFRKAAGMT